MFSARVFNPNEVRNTCIVMPSKYMHTEELNVVHPGPEFNTTKKRAPKSMTGNHCYIDYAMT